ncbi:MAG: PAS domain S-box protein [Chloroflexi bacterium]|nr:PAS domain S-box protein [Chloroflexota bacterium]
MQESLSPTRAADPHPGPSSVQLEPDERRFRELVEALPFIAWVVDDAGRLQHANGRWNAYAGRPPTVGQPFVDDSAMHPDDVEPVRASWLTATRTGDPFAAKARQRRHDGEYRWFHLQAVPSRSSEGTITSWVGTTTDIDDAHRDGQIREQQRFLSDATELLAGSLRYDETIRQLAELVVPRVADWCAIDLLGDDGELRSLTITHVDPEKVALVRRLLEEYPDDPAEPTGSHLVARTGVPILTTDVPPEAIDAFARDPQHAAMLHRLELRSYMCVPLRTGDRILGTLAMASSRSDRRFGSEDLRFAEDLAARAASAIDNATMFRVAERFRLILDSVVEAVILFDPETLTVEEVNRGACVLFSLAREQLIGRSADDLLGSADDDRLTELIEPLLAGVRPATTAVLEFATANGPPGPMEVILQAVDLPGGRLGIVAIARDIRDRIDAQNRLQWLAEAEHARAAELNAVIRAMGEAVVVCAADGTITLTNPAGERFFPDIDEGSYDDILAELNDPEDIAPRLGTKQGPVVLSAQADPDRWVELATYPVGPDFDVPAATRETIVVRRDVTEARRRESVRETFIGVLSHELRTPITTIFGGAKLLARPTSTLDEETRRGIFRDIHDEAERLQRLVEDVVALNRFGDAAGEVGWEPALLQRLLPRVVSSEESRWPGVAFDLVVASGLPAVTADPTYVEQVVRNLVSNAAKYGGAGSTVRVTADAGDDQEVIVRILDDGPGFPPEETTRLFELFYRSLGTAGTATGAGIGLFVCSRLIAAMGGRIWAEPRNAGGAEFGFALNVSVE